MNHEEEKPDEKGSEDLWRAKPGTLLPEMHQTLEGGEWTELPLSFSAVPLFVEGEVRWFRYRITRVEEKAA